VPSGMLAKHKLSLDLLVHAREPVPLLSTILSLFCAVTVSLSSEAVSIGLGGRCKADDFTGCYMKATIFLAPARAIQALLAVCMATVVGLAVFLSKWKTGVAMPPGSLLATGALIQSDKLRTLFRCMPGYTVDGAKPVHKDILAALDDHVYSLGYFRGEAAQDGTGYGIVALTRTDGCRRRRGSNAVSGFRSWFHSSTEAKRRPTHTPKVSFTHWMDKVPFEYVLDCGGLLFIIGLTILVVYYNTTQRPETGFEKFMNTQEFGVRVLFTVFGVILGFFWNCYHTRKCLADRRIESNNGALA